MNRMFGTIDLGVPLTLEDLKEIHKSPEVHRAWEIANKKYGEEVEQKIEEIQTAHDMYPTDDIRGEHTNCQLIGTMWNCGHVDRQYYIGETEGEQLIQLPLWPKGKAWNEEN